MDGNFSVLIREEMMMIMSALAISQYLKSNKMRAMEELYKLKGNIQIKLLHYLFFHPPLLHSVIYYQRYYMRSYK